MHVMLCADCVQRDRNCWFKACEDIESCFEIDRLFLKQAYCLLSWQAVFFRCDRIHSKSQLLRLKGSIQNGCDFNLYNVQFFSLCDAFYSDSKFHHLRAHLFKEKFHSCNHLYSEQWFFCVTISILNSTRIVVDRSCFIYREYVLKEFFVETDLGPPIALSEKDYFNKQSVQLLLK